MEEWKASEKYTELQAKLKQAEDEDEYKNDTDPEGFYMYKEMVSSIPSSCINSPCFQLEGKYDITKHLSVVTSKSKNPDLHAKALPVYLRKGTSSQLFQLKLIKIVG